MFRIIPEGSAFGEYVLLRDGSSLHLRTATPEDLPAVEELHRRVSRESLQLRFMGAMAQVPRAILQTFCSGEPRDRLSLLAIAGQEPSSQVVGMGSYISLGVDGKAEVAFLVDDEHQGRGISTLLLERLAGIAAAHGFVGFTAEVLPENRQMIGVFRDSGFEVHHAFESGLVHVEFPVSGASSMRERVELRERIATANSLVPMLAPKTVAVVGASRDRAAVGSLVFRAILRGGFAGTVYPVNHQASSVNGVRAYASLRDLPEPPELVVVAVPAANVLEVAGEALRAGSKGLLVLTSGFAESGAEGAALQKELVELVRSHGARLVGPNCLGLMNTSPEVSLNASLAQEMPRAGRIGFYSHSAALGLVILDYASRRGLGFSSFVSAGNRADVSGNDLLQFWEEDTATDVALLYLETFGNPRRFTRIARRISYKKPILCVKSARSRAGRALARAHIAAVGQDDTQVDVLFRQAGVIRADTLEEMFDTAALLASQPLPRGNRVAVISNSGGVLTICADTCEANGLSVSGPGVVDLGPFATVEAYEHAVQEAIQHAEVDALIVIFACVGDCDAEVFGRGIRRGVLRGERAAGLPKPVALCLMGAAGAVDVSEHAGGSGRHVFPSYRFPESAARALSKAVHYGAFRQERSGRFVFYEDVDAGAARQEVHELLSSAGDETVWVDGAAAARLLAHFGVAVLGEAEGLTSAGHLEVRSDPSFGPLVVLKGTAGPAVFRITPLTDRDARELLADAQLAAGDDAQQLLGRVSQLIEELPWVCSLSASLHVAGGQAALGPDAAVGLCRG